MDISEIVMISIIFSPWLWERYLWRRKWIGMKNNRKVNEMQLFYGTSKNDPRIVYESKFGFDVRMSKGGKWGWAIYFSEDASYCDRFAYHNTDSCN